MARQEGLIAADVVGGQVTIHNAPFELSMS